MWRAKGNHDDRRVHSLSTGTPPRSQRLRGSRALLACADVAPNEEAVASTAQPLVGTADPDTPETNAATVVVPIATLVTCSGVLVAPQIVMTEASCFPVINGAGADLGSGWTAFAHPISVDFGPTNTSFIVDAFARRERGHLLAQTHVSRPE
jgi:hypothetical protein